MLELVALAGATFCHVGLKAVQQLNVVHDRVMWVGPTSLGLAAAEVYVVASLSRAGWQPLVVVSMAVGATAGCLIAMAAHRIARRNRDRKNFRKVA